MSRSRYELKYENRVSNMTSRVFLALGLVLFSRIALGELQPTIWADVPDPSPIRVGDTYYMTSTTMHCCPGVPVMESKDLMSWKIISYCYDTIEQGDNFTLTNGKHDYGKGSWASSMRYDAESGYFYVSCANVRVKHTYLFRARKPEGPWERFVYTDLMHDHSLWLENGRMYFISSEFNGKIWKAVLHTMKPDLSGFEPESKVICDRIDGNLSMKGGRNIAEGSQLFKHGDYYYLVNICWPTRRVVNVHRAKSLEGPFVEAKLCFDCEGIAQGNYIQKPDGSWVAVIFGDRGGVGRCPYVLPVEWQDGWPIVIARDDYAWNRRPDGIRPPDCVSDDDFSGDRLKLEWQFNHNPVPENCKVANGRLELTTVRIDKDLNFVRNVVSQRTFGPTCEGSIKVDASALKVGDKAGLSLFQWHWGALSVERTESGYDLVLDVPTIGIGERWRGSPNRKAGHREEFRRHLGDCPVVYLKANCDFNLLPKPNYSRVPATVNLGYFSYSLDGKTWEKLDYQLPIPYTAPHFVGCRFALFVWASKEVGGMAAFDDFKVGMGEPIAPKQ